MTGELTTKLQTLTTLHQLWQNQNNLLLPIWHTNPDPQEITPLPKNWYDTLTNEQKTPNINQLAAADHTITDQQQTQLLNTNHTPTLKTLAANPNINHTTHQKLADKHHNYITGTLLDNPNCPTDIIQQILTHNKDKTTLKKALKNPNCPTDIIQQNPTQHASLLQNPNCPTNILQHLSQNPDTLNTTLLTLLLAHRAHTQTTAQTLHNTLAKQTSYYTYDDIDFQWLTQTEQANHIHPYIINQLLTTGPIYDIIKLKQIPAQTLHNILQKHHKKTNIESIEILQNLAANPNCTPEIINQLINTPKPDHILQQNLLANPNTTKTQIQQILTQNTKKPTDPLLLAAAASNPNCPADTLQQIWHTTQNTNQQTYWAEHTTDKILKNPNCTPDIAAHTLTNTDNLTKTLLATKTLLNTNWNQTPAPTLKQTLQHLTKKQPGHTLKTELQHHLTKHIITSVTQTDTPTYIWLTKHAKEQNCPGPTRTKTKPETKLTKPAKTTIQINTTK